jgi:Fur family peroxide stress response transcriptional regulator
MLDQHVAVITLRDSGVRMTPQRLLVIEALAGNRSHPTVEQIFEYVRERYPTVSLATVYQSLALLSRHGLITELHGDRGTLRCDPDTSSHAHAYCRRCGLVMDVPLPPAATHTALDLDTFNPTQVEVSIYGVCAACAGQPSSPVEAEA